MGDFFDPNLPSNKKKKKNKFTDGNLPNQLVYNFKYQATLMIPMGKVFCKLCDKMVDEAAHELKIQQGIIHRITNAAGNPLNPQDTTLAGKFWSS